MATLFYAPRFTPVDAQGDPYPGATLTFYAAGTTTPQPVYSTAALGTPLTNPVVANAAGSFEPIFLDQSASYRVILRDASNVTLFDIDNISSALTAEEVGRTLYPRSTAEISANVTPTAYRYVYGDVRRYGAAVNGTTNDATALQTAITVQAAGGAAVSLPSGRMRIATTVTFGSNTTIRGQGNKSSLLVVPTGSAMTVLRAANTALFNDGAVFEDFGILLANTADIGVDLTSVSRLSMRSVRIWGDESQVAVRGTGVLFDASVASCYANSFFDVDIRNCVKGVHFREAANANFFYGGQIINCTDNIYQEGVTAERTDNCGFFGVRSEATAGNALNITGDVWGWMFSGCRFEAYNSGSKAIRITAGDPTLPPTVIAGCTVAVSGGATDIDFSGLTGRVLYLGQDASEYTATTGTGAYHLGLGTLYVGNPLAAGDATVTAESSSTNADLALVPKGTGVVSSTTGFRGNSITLASATPTGTGAQIGVGNTVRTTVGGAGGGSALPATPRGYLEIDIGGTKRQIPYFDVP
ncbi:MAG: hypothetical protein IPO08_24725 [Xanthomonadales bacterium]|nr:hypothetical protein [Xanthomonadales bacterium]